MTQMQSQLPLSLKKLISFSVLILLFGCHQKKKLIQQNWHLKVVAINQQNVEMNDFLDLSKNEKYRFSQFGKLDEGNYQLRGEDTVVLTSTVFPDRKPQKFFVATIDSFHLTLKVCEDKNDMQLFFDIKK